MVKIAKDLTVLYRLFGWRLFGVKTMFIVGIEARTETSKAKSD